MTMTDRHTANRIKIDRENMAQNNKVSACLSLASTVSIYRCDFSEDYINRMFSQAEEVRLISEMALGYIQNGCEKSLAMLAARDLFNGLNSMRSKYIQRVLVYIT